uniref:NADH-ubiquinone oxidoreductase chain 2 n=1 Tax=Piesma cf. maculatum TaxID=2931304 RepID=A0A8T9ZWK0_9HEMI|nr:NADH dehydrogenase subunit 2 [Piesma cf. maculatum]
MFNYSKMLFFSFLILGTLLTLNSNNWMSMWMGMELNLMSFIPLISQTKNKSNSQSMMIYFLTQSIGTSIMLFSILMILMNNNMISNNIINYMTVMSLLLKLGAAPMHMWLPEMMSNMNWLNCTILMTWQKIAPLIMLMYTNMNSSFFYIIILMSTIVGAIGAMNLSSLRKIMAYSSINHMGWIMMMMSMKMQWMKYLIIYSIMVIMQCKLFSMYNAFFINQFINNSYSLMEKYNNIIMFLSMGGLPPFLGFLPKWMVLWGMMETNITIMMMVMIMMSMITLFFYMRIVSSFILSYSMMNKWIYINKINNYWIMSILLMNLSLPVISVMTWF